MTNTVMLTVKQDGEKERPMEQPATGKSMPTARRVPRRARAAAMGLVMLAASALGVGLAPSASAYHPQGPWINSWYSGGANLRSCPNTGCSRIAYLTNGNHLNMHCWGDYQNALGNYWSPRWFLISVPFYQGTAWVHSSLVANQSVVGRCY